MRIILTAAIILGVVPFACAQSNQADSVTITTYYPSPYGVYGILRLNPRDKPATCREGEMTYDKATATRGLYFCNETLQWQKLSGGQETLSPGTLKGYVEISNSETQCPMSNMDTCVKSSAPGNCTCGSIFSNVRQCTASCEPGWTVAPLASTTSGNLMSCGIRTTVTRFSCFKN
ncbi:MAG: hypothetical protein PHT59_03020 [Candidatus Omnitrophica bacterium]|nr:hypothetical protein [Candidatus Omnitrophota bacterium]